jgi:hypothetical protein
LYVAILKEAGLNPIELWAVMSKKSLFEISDNIEVARRAADSHICDGMKDCPLRPVIAGLKKSVDVVAIGTRGLCLDCVNAERETTGLDMNHPEKPKCRVAHVPFGAETT